jgi:hypothetical protein
VDFGGLVSGVLRAVVNEGLEVGGGELTIVDAETYVAGMNYKGLNCIH